MSKVARVESLKRVANGSFQVEFSQFVTKPGNRRINPLLSIMNEGDERFGAAPKPRRAWMVITERDNVIKFFGDEIADLGYTIDQIDALAQGETLTLGFDAPLINNQPLNLEVFETTEPRDDYSVNNIDKAAKQVIINGKILSNDKVKKAEGLEAFEGEVGYFVDTTSKKPIFSYVEVVAGTPEHTFIEGMLVSKSAMYGSIAMANPKPVAEKESVTV